MLQLREFTESDLALAEAWLHKAHVRKWYEIPQLGVTLEDWMMEYKERNGNINGSHISLLCGKKNRSVYVSITRPQIVMRILVHYHALEHMALIILSVKKTVSVKALEKIC